MWDIRFGGIPDHFRTSPWVGCRSSPDATVLSAQASRIGRSKAARCSTGATCATRALATVPEAGLDPSSRPRMQKAPLFGAGLWIRSRCVSSYNKGGCGDSQPSSLMPSGVRTQGHTRSGSRRTCMLLPVAALTASSEASMVSTSLPAALTMVLIASLVFGRLRHRDRDGTILNGSGASPISSLPPSSL